MSTAKKTNSDTNINTDDQEYRKYRTTLLPVVEWNLILANTEAFVSFKASMEGLM